MNAHTITREGMRTMVRAAYVAGAVMLAAGALSAAHDHYERKRTCAARHAALNPPDDPWPDGFL